jgi:hypothetical protein
LLGLVVDDIAYHDGESNIKNTEKAQTRPAIYWRDSRLGAIAA